jgi:hypothetical protein
MSETRSKKILTGEIILNNNKNYKQGKFKPKNPQKYKGNCQNIVYRSSYELIFMNYCDLTESVIEYQSEEFYILYKDPLTGSTRRYFPDFFVKYKDRDNNIRTLVVEIKPAKDLKEPNPNPPKRTSSWVYSVKTWAVNQAKWKAAREWCADHNYEFKIMTEKDLGIEIK